MTPLNSQPAAERSGGLAGERDALRRLLRARRAALTEQQRAAFAHSITRHVAATRWLQAARPIALYVSVGSEVRTESLRALARRRRCPVYLPRIVDYRHGLMRFAHEADGVVRHNRHGIPEPALAQSLPARALSVVFVPLLGFDAQGTRLGAGAGYYDRAFAFRRHRRSWHRPLLIGLAYRCQRLAHIESRPHDVPLDAVVTEEGVICFKRPVPEP